MDASASALPSAVTYASASSSPSATMPACASLLFDVAALKIVDDAQGGLHITALKREDEQVRLLTARVDLPLEVRNALPRLLQPFTLAGDFGAAMLSGPVGESLTDTARSESLWLEVCKALLLLHLSAIVHGDPRMPNLVRVPIDTRVRRRDRGH